jgi:formylglycine-generating enzyme required for sulfatase activity
VQSFWAGFQEELSKPEPAPNAARQHTVQLEVITVNEKGEIINRENREALGYNEPLVNGVVLSLVHIPAGSFVMGSPDSEEGRQNDEGPQREVTVPAFWMGQYAITQAQYQAVMGENPSHFKGLNLPVEQVSWHQAVEFCQNLSKLTGLHYRLPSKAEWEYACRAGTTTPFHFGPTITTDLANYNGDMTYGNGLKGICRQATIDVGQFFSNSFGLYDMHGNIADWCADLWHNNYKGAPIDGSAWLKKGFTANRIVRGGFWFFSPQSCRSACRDRLKPSVSSSFLGFRVVCGGAR